MNHLTVFATKILGLTLLMTACDAPDAAAPAPTPEPFAGFIVYVADGVWNPATSEPPLTLEQTQRERWGLSDAEIASYRAEAAAFYEQRFGVDIDDPANAERVHVLSFGCDPRLAYRVVTMAGREVPPEGWPICDAGYLVTITDPNGFELGGEFAGLHAPVGASMSFGRYQIDTGGEPLDVAFRSLTPYVSDPYGAAAIRCEIDSPQLGVGEANLVFKLDQLPSGEFALMIRNVLTFDG